MPVSVKYPWRTAVIKYKYAPLPIYTCFANAADNRRRLAVANV